MRLSLERRVLAGGAVLVAAGVLGLVLIGQTLMRPSAINASPSARPSASTAAGDAPRSGWSYHRLTAAEQGLMGVAEIRGRLYAWGRSKSEPTIWFSDDGTTWTKADMPSGNEGCQRRKSPAVDCPVYQVADIGGRLYAWGTTNREPRIWISEDGASWTTATMPTADASCHARMAGAPCDVHRIVEMDGRLYAWGHDGRWKPGFEQPAVWASEDGRSWRAMDFPDVRLEYASIHTIVDTGEQLVALAVGGVEYPDDIDFRLTSTMIFSSSDGESWQQVTDTPGVDAGYHGVLLKVGAKLLAVGDDVWESTDGGRSWAVSATPKELGGSMSYYAAETEGLILGLGDSLDGPPAIWTSSDGGDTWKRRKLARTSRTDAFNVSRRADGQIVLSGAGLDHVWISNDEGETWERTSPATKPREVYFFRSMTALPAGYAATGEADHRAAVWTSHDGVTWTRHKVRIDPESILWSPTFGLVVTGHRWKSPNDWQYVALGPQLFP
jgi:photosystem II stability/assembly factor-like uncharacterized protein